MVAIVIITIIIIYSKLPGISWAPMTHSCNASYSGQRSGGLQVEVSLDKSFLETLSQKSPSQKRTGGVAQGVGSKFKP
jgi:hypothetical protein